MNPLVRGGKLVYQFLTYEVERGSGKQVPDVMGPPAMNVRRSAPLRIIVKSQLLMLHTSAARTLARGRAFSHPDTRSTEQHITHLPQQIARQTGAAIGLSCSSLHA